jgi:hypothetical protein
MSHCCDWSIGAACGPDHARGLVPGLHASSLAGGGALASSLTGVLIDRWAPGPAVLVVGTVGIGAAAFSWALARASPGVPSATPRPSARSHGGCGRLGGDECEPGVRPA